MQAEKQYIDIFTTQRETIERHSSSVMNSVRQQAFDDFCRKGFPTKKVERYKYTDIPSLFAPEDYGLNLNRLTIPVNPNQVFRCDVPNLTTSPHFVINDQLYSKTEKQGSLPEGVIVGSLYEESSKNKDFIGRFYGKLANTADDGITALNTMLAQDGLFVYVPKNVRVDNVLQVINVLRSDVDMMINRRV